MDARERIVWAAEQAIDSDLRIEAHLRVAAWSPAEREAAMREMYSYMMTHQRHRLKKPLPDVEKWVARRTPGMTRILELMEFGRLRAERALDIGSQRDRRWRGAR